MNKKLFFACLVFLAAFSVYLFSAVPAITEDDSGELCAVGATLGTAHSPGYPLYCLLTKLLVTVERMGNTAYRVNLASSLALGAAGALMFIICLEVSGSYAAAAAVALAFSFSSSVWAMANVTEVYGLTSFITVLMWYVMFKVSVDENYKGEKYFYAVMFLFGLGITAHYTVGLLLPGVVWWTIANRDRLFGTAWRVTVINGALWGLAGFSAVLYLYVRAHSDPVIGWEDPRTLGRFWQVIARLRYGTVSLAQGGPPPLSPEIMFGKIAFYASDLNANFTFCGVFLFLVGVFKYLEDKRCGWTLFILILGSGPGFVLLANAGTDAVSRELMERFFFLSFIFAAVTMAAGLKELPKYLRGAFLFLPAFLLWHNIPELNHRQEYMYYDYGKSILHSLPPKTLLFSDRADEMEFAVTYLRIAGRMRNDLEFVDCNAGATKSIYGNAYYRIWGKPRLEIRERVEREMMNNYTAGPVYYATFFPDMINIPRIREGLVFRAKPAEPKKSVFPYDDIYTFRVPEETEYLNGRLRDLVLSYYQLLGEYFVSGGDKAKARLMFSGVTAYDATGSWTANLGFIYHQYGMIDEAVECYERTIKRGKETVGLYINLGAIYEQKGNTDEAVKCYSTAISMAPENSQAHYNLAVVYWKQGYWEGVIKEFQKVLEIDPSNESAKRYRSSALARRNDKH